MVKTNQLYHKEKFVYKEKYQERIIKKGGRNEFFDRLFYAKTYDDKPLNANIASLRMKYILITQFIYISYKFSETFDLSIVSIVPKT
jgi:hypothetical protein